MNTVKIYGIEHDLGIVSIMLNRPAIATCLYYHYSGINIWCFSYEVKDTVNDVNLITALAELYPLLLYCFYDEEQVMQGRRSGIDSDDYINYTTTSKWSLYDIMARNYTLGYNLYPIDIRCNLGIVYHKLAATTYKAMADEALLIEEAITRETALAPSEEEEPIYYALYWLLARRIEMRRQDASDVQKQRLIVINAAITMINEHVKQSK